MRTPVCGIVACALTALALASQALPSQALAQSAPMPVGPGNKPFEVGKNVGDIVTQPARDVNLQRTTIPPVLIDANTAPYSTRDLQNCRTIVDAVRRLDDALGQDFVVVDPEENRGAKLAEATGRWVVNRLIPFRSLVREVSGAAPAQRRLDEAISAGYARRGFLRGVGYARGCPPIGAPPGVRR